MADDLKTVLLDLLHELPTNLRLMIGGGYGLFLKQEHLVGSEVRTLLPTSRWPQPRATNDIDVLLRPEVVTTAKEMKALRETLDRLAFERIEGAKFYQFRNNRS